MLIPEQKKVPPMPGPIIKASEMQINYISQKNMFMLEDASNNLKLKKRIMDLIDLRQQEATRVRNYFPKHADPNIIDAYNKGMLYKLESEIEDLKSLLSE